MTIVVTGGSGKLGQHVIRELLAHGHRVLSLDRTRPANPPCTAWVADLTCSGDVYQALRQADGVIHLGAYHEPDDAPDTETFTNNVTATYHVMKAAADLGVPRVVWASSIAAYGFVYAPRPFAPDCLPLDEQHPCRPQDSYGLSKVVGEQIADSVVRVAPLTIASLRFPWVVLDPTYGELTARWCAPGQRPGALWCYIDARDAASACRLALKGSFAGHEVFNVAAPTSLMREPTTELVQRHVPPGARLRAGLDGNWSAMDSSKAQRVLGFQAQYTWQQHVSPDVVAQA